MIDMLKNLVGMKGITDQVIATDFLISSKSAVINTALALTESATSELRDALEQELLNAIDTHDAISDYMIANGYYHPHELKEQFEVDLQTAEVALNLAEKKSKN